MTGDWTDSQIITLPETMMKEMVKSKIMNYTDLLAAFNDVSDKVWYGPMWSVSILIGMITWMEQSWPRYYFSPAALSDSWFGCNEMAPKN